MEKLFGKDLSNRIIEYIPFCIRYNCKNQTDLFLCSDCIRLMSYNRFFNCDHSILLLSHLSFLYKSLNNKVSFNTLQMIHNDIDNLCYSILFKKKYSLESFPIILTICSITFYISLWVNGVELCYNPETALENLFLDYTNFETKQTFIAGVKFLDYFIEYMQHHYTCLHYTQFFTIAKNYQSTIIKPLLEIIK